MDELSEKLAEILNDPDSMERVRQMAENLLGGQGEPAPPEPDATPDLFAGVDLKNIMSLISTFNNAKPDNNTKLLAALKPLLSEPKREKVDTAIKILKLLDILPLIKESGLLNL